MHTPVLQKEVIQYLSPGTNRNFIDCTCDGGGHLLAILKENGPEGKILGIDQDPELLKEAKDKIKEKGYQNRVSLACDNFANLTEIVKREKFKKIFGILFDLGMSSWQLEESGRGFSFLKKEPLDMRYNPQNPLTAGKIINYWSESEIERILREYGEERFSSNIAKEIIRERKINPIKNTLQLVKIIKKSVPKKYQSSKINPATLTFQALRITVNDEIDNLKRVLPQAVEVLEAGGKLVVISFHSLEDRIVKNFYKEKGQENLIKILNKKPIIPTKKEIKKNPRSRSSKLRAAEKI